MPTKIKAEVGQRIQILVSGATGRIWAIGPDHITVGDVKDFPGVLDGGHVEYYCKPDSLFDGGTIVVVEEPSGKVMAKSAAQANGNLPAYMQEDMNDGVYKGLTKREDFAKAAMQGLIAKNDRVYPNTCAEIAVQYADALLNELEN